MTPTQLAKLRRIADEALALTTLTCGVNAEADDAAVSLCGQINDLLKEAGGEEARPQITGTLYDRIERHRATNEWAKSNHNHYTSTDYAALMPIIGELAERLEAAHDLFQDLDELPYVPGDLVQEGMDLTDIVQDYPLEKPTKQDPGGDVAAEAARVPLEAAIVAEMRGCKTIAYGERNNTLDMAHRIIRKHFAALTVEEVASTLWESTPSQCDVTWKEATTLFKDNSAHQKCVKAHRDFAQAVMQLLRKG